MEKKFINDMHAVLKLENKTVSDLAIDTDIDGYVLGNRFNKDSNFNYKDKAKICKVLNLNIFNYVNFGELKLREIAEIANILSTNLNALISRYEMLTDFSIRTLSISSLVSDVQIISATLIRYNLMHSESLTFKQILELGGLKVPTDSIRNLGIDTAICIIIHEEITSKTKRK